MTYRIEITPDESAESPREWDNLGILALFHKRYALPNESGLDSRDFGSWAEMEKHITDNLGIAMCLPVYGYDHSELSISTSFRYPYNDRFDAGQLGFIYAPRERIIAEYGDDTAESIDKARAVLEAEVKIYGQYLTGDVWRFIIYNDEGEIVDSCGGFYEYDECENEGNLSLAYLNQEEEKKQKRVEFMMCSPYPFIDQSPALAFL